MEKEAKVAAIKNQILSAVNICKSVGIGIDYNSGRLDVGKGSRINNSACPLLCLTLVCTEIYKLPYDPQKWTEVVYTYDNEETLSALDMTENQLELINFGLAYAYFNVGAPSTCADEQLLGYEIGMEIWE